MVEQTLGRFKVIVKEGSPRGDLFELEQATYFYVVDSFSDEIVLSYRGDVEASLSRETGMWDDYRYSGVAEVEISFDESAVVVRYFDGREERVSLPD